MVRRIKRATPSDTANTLVAEPEPSAEDTSEEGLFEEDAVEEEPTKRRARSNGIADEDDVITANVSGGWDEYRKMRDSIPSDFLTPFKVTETATLIKFLETKPFASFPEHFLAELPKGKKKSWTCAGKGCPICKIGHKPSYRSLFNILVVDSADSEEDDAPEPYNDFLAVGITVANQIEDFAKSKITSPLNSPNWYYEIKKSGAQGRIGLQKVKARDVEEDWGLEPLSEEEFAKYAKDLKTNKDIPVPTRRELQEIADLVDD